ncbi:MAG TPA: hypothetical protein VMA72_26990 [Streptosporangiaceae bacterium]|nr:hypothetical protein [Streptosporangiaceae bacterium]
MPRSPGPPVEGFLADPRANELSQRLHGSLHAGGEQISVPAAFTEPNLALTIDGSDNDGVRLRIRFSHESLPDWIRDCAGWQSPEYFVVLDMSGSDLAEAVSD